MKINKGDVKMEHNKELGGKNVPIPECVGKPFQYDYEGNFRIVVKGHESCWTSPYEVATLIIEGEWVGNDEVRNKEIYIGVSGVYTGDLPKECPLLITVVDGDGDANFVQVKVVDLDTGETLDEDEVEEQLYDSAQAGDLGVTVKASSIKDYVKVGIIEYGNSVGEEHTMLKEDVESYLIKVFCSDEFDLLDVDGNKIN